MGIKNFNELHLVPVLQLVVGQVQLRDVSTERFDPGLVSCLADAPAAGSWEDQTLEWALVSVVPVAFSAGIGGVHLRRRQLLAQLARVQHQWSWGRELKLTRFRNSDSDGRQAGPVNHSSTVAAESSALGTVSGRRRGRAHAREREMEKQNKLYQLLIRMML